MNKEKIKGEIVKGIFKLKEIKRDYVLKSYGLAFGLCNNPFTKKGFNSLLSFLSVRPQYKNKPIFKELYKIYDVVK